MKRRKVITSLFSVAAVGPSAASGQQVEKKRLAILSNLSSDDPVGKARVDALLRGLERLGWVSGKNLTVEARWDANGLEESRVLAAQLVALAPDVAFAATTANVAALQQASRTVPIVFAGVSDPVGAGLVSSLGQPGGQTTGFSLAEYGISVKWLELLKEASPKVSRVAILSAAEPLPGSGSWRRCKRWRRP